MGWRRGPRVRCGRCSGAMDHGSAWASHEPRGKAPRHERGAPNGTEAMDMDVVSTVLSVSNGAVATSNGALAARGATYNGAAAERADSLHPTMETTEATNSMTAMGNEAAPTDVLANQAEEERDEAWHLTDGLIYLLERHDDPRGGVASREMRGLREIHAPVRVQPHVCWVRGDSP